MASSAKKVVGEDGNPEERIEIVGCRTLADFLVRADEAEESKNDQEH